MPCLPTSRFVRGAIAVLLVLVVGACRDADERAVDGGVWHDTAVSDAGPDGATIASDRVTVGTWNLLHFSAYGEGDWRLPDLASKIESLPVDLLGVQELEIAEGSTPQDSQAYHALLLETPSFTGLHNPFPSFDTCVGLMVRSATTAVLGWQTILDGDSYAFPRPPLHAAVRVTKGDHELDFDVIVVHLKAFGDSVDRRRAACLQLDGYVRARPERHFVILGDFNDDPYDPPQDNAFGETFVGTEPDYYFVTLALPPESSTSVGWYHTVGDEQITGEFIDHAVVTGGFFALFSGVVPTIHNVSEWQYDDWRSDYSDHFPVTVDFVF